MFPVLNGTALQCGSLKVGVSAGAAAAGASEDERARGAPGSGGHAAARGADASRARLAGLASSMASVMAQVTAMDEARAGRSPDAMRQAAGPLANMAALFDVRQNLSDHGVARPRPPARSRPWGWTCDLRLWGRLLA